MIVVFVFLIFVESKVCAMLGGVKEGEKRKE